MAIQWFDLQQFCAANDGTTTHLINVWDDGGLPLTNFEQTGGSAALVGLWTASIVSGKAQLALNANGVTPGFYYWEGRASTDNGSNWSSIPSGGNVYVYAPDVETITIGSGSTQTMTADLPSAGKTKLVVNFTDATSVLDGTASNFKIVATDCKGGIFLNGPGKLYRLGSSTTYAVDLTATGDSPLVMTGLTIDTCGGVHYKHNLKGDGYLTYEDNTVLTNSTVPVTTDPADSVGHEQLLLELRGNRFYPNTFKRNRIGKGYVYMNATSDFVVGGSAANANVFQGLRCGVQGAGFDGVNDRITVDYNYCDTGQTLVTWTQVAQFYFPSTILDSFTNNIGRHADWQVRAFVGGVIEQNVFADHASHTVLDLVGGSAAITVRNNIFLPLVTYPFSGSSYVNGSRIEARGASITVQHNTFVSYTGASTEQQHPIVALWADQTIAFKDNLMANIVVSRGTVSGSPTGDAAVSPSSAAGAWEDLSGTPLRPASTPNRLTFGDYNGFYNDASGRSEPYSDYGVGVTTGTLGANDVNADPQFVTGSYTFPSDSDIWARAAGATVEAMLAAVRAAFTLGASSPMRSAASDATHIGAVQLTPPSSGAPAKLIFRHA